MELAAVMDDIAGRLETIDGLRTFAHPAANISPPAAIVSYPGEYTYDATFGRGMDRINLPVVVLVGKVSERSSRDRLGAYVNGDGAQSIKAVIEGEGNPGWLDLPGGAGNYVQTPHRASQNITGRLWLAVDCALDDWTPAAFNTLISKWLELFNIRAYRLGITTAGRPQASISSNGTNVMSADGDVLGFTDGTRHAVGVEIVPDNGSSQRTFQFYTADTIAGPWTPFGSLITQAGAVSTFVSSTVVAIGARDGGAGAVAAGLFYGAEIRSGDRTGTLVANPDFTNVEPGAHAFLDSLENPWILEGTAVIVAGSPPAPYTAFDSVRVEDVDFDVVSMAGVDYLAATFNLDVLGTGDS